MAAVGARPQSPFKNRKEKGGAAIARKRVRRKKGNVGTEWLGVSWAEELLAVRKKVKKGRVGPFCGTSEKTAGSDMQPGQKRKGISVYDPKNVDGRVKGATKKKISGALEVCLKKVTIEEQG